MTKLKTLFYRMLYWVRYFRSLLTSLSLYPIRFCLHQRTDKPPPSGELFGRETLVEICFSPRGAFTLFCTRIRLSLEHFRSG